VGVTVVDMVNLAMTSGMLAGAPPDEPSDPRRLLLPLDEVLLLRLVFDSKATWLKGDGLLTGSGCKGCANGDVVALVGAVPNILGVTVGALKLVGVVLEGTVFSGRPDKFAKNWSATD
jgi:hypothetical protein